MFLKRYYGIHYGRNRPVVTCDCHRMLPEASCWLVRRDSCHVYTDVHPRPSDMFCHNGYGLPGAIGLDLTLALGKNCVALRC